MHNNNIQNLEDQQIESDCLDKVIDNPISGMMRHVGKMVVANKNLITRLFVIYGATRTMLSNAGCMPSSSFEIEPSKCLLTGDHKPLIDDSFLMNIALVNFCTNIAITSLIAYLRKFLIHEQNIDVFQSLITMGPNLEERFRKFNVPDIIPSAISSLTDFQFINDKEFNSVVPLAHLILNLTTLSFFNDKFISLPREEFLKIMDIKIPNNNQEALSQSHDLILFQSEAQNHINQLAIQRNQVTENQVRVDNSVNPSARSEALLVFDQTNNNISR